MEDDLDYKVVLGLKKDLNILQDKMTKALESDNVGTYINLQKALVNSLNAIKELSNEYELMYSAYTTGENKQKQVAIWEQNSDGDIRNHKVWNVHDYGLKADTLNGSISKQEDKLDWLLPFEINIDSVVDSFSVNDKIIIPTSEACRGVGKTTYLLKKAFENNGIYVGRDKCMNKLAMDMSRKLFGSIVDSVYFSPESCDGNSIKFTSDRKLYIDEGVDLERINMEDSKYVIFKYIPLNFK